MKPRLVGIDHVALQVDDLEAAVEFYCALFERGSREEEPHFGLVVENKEAARRALEEAGMEILPGHRLDFRDTSGNRVQIVQYDQIQFTKTERILTGMGLSLGKTEAALDELRGKGLAD